MADADAMAEMVVMAIKTALAPLQAKQQALQDALAEIRITLADPSGEQARIAMLERVVALETKAAQPLPAVDFGGVHERLMALDVSVTKSVAGVSERLSVVETKAANNWGVTVPSHAITVEPDQTLVDLRARVAGLETKSQTDTVAQDLSGLRERIAVIETRAPVPGPAGADGLNGKDGADGLGWDDFEEVFDGERTFTKRYSRNGHVKEFSHKVAYVLDRGVWKSGLLYEKGDGVSWGGSFWIAQTDTDAKPGESGPESRAWRLAVKKGRDGGPSAVKANG